MFDMDSAERTARFTPRGKLIRTDIWKKGEYVDLWSVAHTLSGVALGFYPRYFHLGIVAALAAAFVLLVMYELFEVVVQIQETLANHTTDVLFGLIGFTSAYFFALRQGGTGILACGIATAVAIAVSAIGWSYSYKAYAIEKKFRAECGRA
jgi:hypothetical protein